MGSLWLAFAAVTILSFLVLGWIGTRIYQEMPPVPDKFVTADGVTLTTRLFIAVRPGNLIFFGSFC